MNNDYIKYPRTYHLPYSLTMSDDDKRLESDKMFENMDQVYCTIKMDGENTTVYSDGYIHARSIDGNKHPWQSWLKQYIQIWYKLIPNGWRVCGENLYATHSISYTFPDETYYFQVFGIYNENNIRLSYEEMIDWCCMLDIHFVPTFSVGQYSKKLIMEAFDNYKSKSENEVEGFVVSNVESFKYEDFSKNVGKFVRANHVQTDQHWSEHWTKNLTLR